MKMEAKKNSKSSRSPSSKLLPLKQNPITPALASLPPDATQTILLNDLSARLSSSPASSPRIVDSPSARRGSVHPAMSGTMEKGLNPGADFFNDESSESDWEDSDGGEDFPQAFSDTDAHGLGNESRRGRSRERNTITSLPPYNQFLEGLGISNMVKPPPKKMGENEPKMAREMSLRRLSKESVRVVHNRSKGGTPRDSLSNDSGEAFPFANFSKSFPPTGSMPVGPPQHRELCGRHRRNTSESLLAGSIIDAHVMTMRALESLNQSPSGTPTSKEISSFPNLSSFSRDRHIKLSPLRTTSIDRDPDRPLHLPSHFVKTPYPFTEKKEFPKPKSRPRQHNSLTGWRRMDSVDKVRDGYSDRKGKHVLGLASVDGEYDQRSRQQRNEDAQGVVRTRTESSSTEDGESVVWLSLDRRNLRRKNSLQETRKIVRVSVPSSLTTSESAREGKQTVDFDDQYFAKRLGDGHRQLAGPWIRRLFSARKLGTIRLSQVSSWSGSSRQGKQRSASGLLATSAGFDLDMDAKSPFTEDSLMALYRQPASGKARYTWVHWARRISATNTPRQAIDRHSTQSSRPRARSLDTAGEKSAPSSIHALEANSETLPENITTIQFVHSFSIRRILAAIVLMLVLSVAAAVLWIFLGPEGSGWRMNESRQRVNRVSSGMAIGILALLLESLAFGAWLCLS